MVLQKMCMLYNVAVFLFLRGFPVLFTFKFDSTAARSPKVPKLIHLPYSSTNMRLI